jgi:bidirectional [NiFe] hydrogenase diaphorase subunit
MVTAAMRRLGFDAAALIETLHSAQEAFGCLDETALRYAAGQLGLPLSHVYGVATFYNLFTLKPQGAHTCVVCMGTACYIKGGAPILAEIERRFQLRPGETTPDQRVSLLVARCLGTCGLAPAAVYDGVIVGSVAPASAAAQIEEWLGDEP